MHTIEQAYLVCTRYSKYVWPLKQSMEKFESQKLVNNMNNEIMQKLYIYAQKISCFFQIPKLS